MPIWYIELIDILLPVQTTNPGLLCERDIRPAAVTTNKNGIYQCLEYIGTARARVKL